MEAPSEKKSLAQLRAEVKEIRKSLYKPVSRSKKAELEAEISRHKGITSATSTKVEKVEEEAKPEKKTKPKKAEPKKAEPKKEEKKVKESKKKPVEKKEKKKD
jgi:hypothetical protein